jgi:hypothetical protein
LIDALQLRHPLSSTFDGASFLPYVHAGGGADRPIYLEARGGAQAEKIFLIRGMRCSGKGIAFAPFEGERAPVEFFGPAQAEFPLSADEARLLMDLGYM